MKFITENWLILVALATAIGCAVHFLMMPSTKQLQKVSEWMLYAVTKAEKELGAGTGQIKLRYVYDMFIVRFTWLARVIPFDTFVKIVDDALTRMREQLENQKYRIPEKKEEEK